MSAGTVNAATLSVNCGGKGALSTIGGALKLLQNVPGPSTINVSGTCNEDVVIQGMDHLTMNAVNGASINDASQGANVTLTIEDSRDVAINNFVVNGYAAGTSGNDVVECLDASVCRFSNDTVQNAPQGAGIAAYSGSYVDIEGGFLQNNSSWAGLAVIRSAKVRAQGVTLQSNWRGAVVAEGGHLQLNGSTIANNTDMGIMVRGGAILSCVACTVTGNGRQGINAEENSAVTLQSNSTVTGNGGAGINLTNVSTASFWDGTGSVTGNNAALGDIVCNPKYATTVGLPATVGIIVNCP